MAFIDESKNGINFKIDHCGTGLGGRATNLQYIHSKIAPEFKSKMFSRAARFESTLYFDFMPRTMGLIDGRQPRIHLYTVPGSVFYSASRGLILKRVGGVVLVADSQVERLDGSPDSLDDLNENMKSHGLKFRHQRGSASLVLQYNKRELLNTALVSEMDRQLNRDGLPHFEAVVHLGSGVFDTLKAIANSIVNQDE